MIKQEEKKISKKNFSEEKKEKIIKAGIKIFARKNYMRATTKEIAKEAAIAEGGLYKHFSSKEKLYVAIINYIGEKMIFRWKEIEAKAKNPLEIVYIIGITHFDKILKNKTYTKLIFQAISETSIPEVKEALKKLYMTYLSFLGRVLDEGKKCSLIVNSLDTNLAAWNIVSLGFTLNLIGLLGFEGKGDQKFAHELGGLLFKALSENFYTKKYLKEE